MAKVGPGRAIGREMAAGDRADAEVDAFISRRHDRRVTEEGERPAEGAWMESERREAARRRAENRVGWYSWHMHRAELYGRLSREHAANAEGLMEETDEREAS